MAWQRPHPPRGRCSHTADYQGARDCVNQHLLLEFIFLFRVWTEKKGVRLKIEAFYTGQNATLKKVLFTAAKSQDWMTLAQKHTQE